ncbi:hypothetical protein CBF45_07595 [Bordetella sp. J329]|nr:hypothetical protein CBF45_07595 [Bordetella sp. J329]
MSDFRSNLPLGTQDPVVLKANAGNLDEAVSNPEPATWTDRFGNERPNMAAVEQSAPLASAAADRADQAAERAENAATAAALGIGTYYENIAAGRAAVTDGQSFWVEPNSTDGLTRFTMFTRLSSTTEIEKFQALSARELSSDIAALTAPYNYAPDPLWTNEGVDDGAYGDVLQSDSGPIMRFTGNGNRVRDYRVPLRGHLSVPGTTIYIGATMRSSVLAGARVDIRFYNAAGTNLQTITAFSNLIDSDQVRYASGVVPEGAAYASFRAMLNNTSGVEHYAEISSHFVGVRPPSVYLPPGRQHPVRNEWADSAWTGEGVSATSPSFGSIQTADSFEPLQPYLELANGVTYNEIRQYDAFPAVGAYAPGRTVFIEGLFRSDAARGVSVDLVFLNSAGVEVLPEGGRLEAGNGNNNARWWNSSASRVVPASAVSVRPRVVRWGARGATYGRVAQLRVTSERASWNRIVDPYRGGASGAATPGASAIYVAPTGSDSNPGTATQPKATFAAAIESLGGAGVIIASGTFRGVGIPLAGVVDLTVLRGRDQDLVLQFGTWLTDATKTAGRTNVYQVPLAAAPDSSGSVHGHCWLWEHGTPSMLVDEAEDGYHPLRRSQQYRLPSARLVQALSVDAVDSTPGSWFWESGVLYLHAPDSGDASARQYVVPESSTGKSGVSGGTGHQKIGIVGATVMYANEGINVSDVAHYELIECRALCNRLNGIKVDRSSGREVRNQAGGNNNDGTNCHGWTTGADNPNGLITVRECVDPWCHDNGDDGESSHRRSNVTAFGGLFEYNGGRGIATANGCQYTAYQPTTVGNGVYQPLEGEGIAVVGQSRPDIGDRFTSMIVHGGSSTRDRVGAAANGEGTHLRLIGTELRDSTDYALWANRGTIVHTNVRESGAPVQKHTTNGGQIVADNAALVE